MSLLDAIAYRLGMLRRALFDRAALRRELDEELALHMELDAMHRRHAGDAPGEARRAARVKLGHPARARAPIVDATGVSALDALAQDLRFAARSLRLSPGYTAGAALTLALGIGATTAVFGAASPILLEPLPYPDAARVAAVWEVGDDGAPMEGSFGMYRGLAERTRAFDALAAYRPWQPTATAPAAEPERLDGQRVSASWFRVLGVAPALGRPFHQTEDRLGGPDVVVLSDALWRRRFGADPAIVGREVTLDDARFVVVGVMPRGFENVLAPAAELWAPLQYDLSQGRAWGHHLRLVGRLRRGADEARATRELDAIGGAVLAAWRPQTYPNRVAFRVAPLRDDLTRGVRGALLAVLGAAALVLAIACVNVANLTLARGLRRRGELAVRAALGAGRGRLLRQSLVETLLLAALGGAGGIVVAALGVRALVALAPRGLPRVEAIGVDGAAFAFALAVAALTGIAVGLAPALHAARGGPHADLQRGSRRTAGGRGRARAALVAAEVSLAVVLLVGSGLLLRSVARLLAVEPGFDASHVLAVQVQTAGRRFADDGAARRFFAEALDAVRRVPGVATAGLTSQLPLAGELDLYGVRLDPSRADDPGEVRGTQRYAVSADYLAAMRIPLRRGRALDARDGAGTPRVALVSESMARRRLRGVDPVGARLRVGGFGGEPYTVVGVVADVKHSSLALDDPGAVYVPSAQWPFADGVMWIVVRARGDAAALAPAVRRAVWSVDRDQAVARVATMASLLADSARERRFALTLFAAFALTALALAAAGIYGALAGSVAERTREIGVRAALGAARGRVLAQVLGEGMGIAALGAVAGVAGAAAASEAIAALLFGVSRLDPLTYAGVLALLAAVAAAACAVPAWRAARVDPAVVLRAE